MAAGGSGSTEDKRVLAELSQGCVLNSDCKSPLADGRCRDFCDSPSRTPTRVWSRRAMGVGGGIHDGEQGPEVTGRDGDRAGPTKEEVKWVDYLRSRRIVH